MSGFALRATWVALAIALAAAGCGGGNNSSSSAPPAGAATTTAPRPTTTPAREALVLRIYLLRDGSVRAAGRRVGFTKAVARAALEALLAGPTGTERDAGLNTDVPTDARLLDLSVSDGTATVDLSRSFAAGAEATISARLAQVVYTLTQFPTIAHVRFRVEGEPLATVTDGVGALLDHPAARADYEALTPPLLPESPLPGDTVTSPLRISGTANAFEATFQADIVDAHGKVLAHTTVMATSGSGERGTFDESLPFTGEGAGKLVVYENSAADGSRIHQVEVPLTLH